MALLAGTVTIATDGTATSTPNSLAKGIYDSFLTTYPTYVGEPLPPQGENYAVKNNLAWLATALASAVVTHVTTLGVVTTNIKVVAGHAGIASVPLDVATACGTPYPEACEGPHPVDFILDNQGGTIS